MSTRAGAAAHSRQIQQRLVRLLFDHKCAKKGREQHRKLDFASYTYADLRSAYLERIQSTHPDKFFNRKESYRNGPLESTIRGSLESRNSEEQRVRPQLLQHDLWDKQDATTYFIELQDAWKNYDNFYKHMRQSLGDQGEGNFTMFGVGCSFSDNPEERELRNEIMDQACKGWFSAGSLSEGLNADDGINSASARKISTVPVRSTLISEDELFVHASEADKTTSSTKTRSRSLVENLRPSRSKSL